MMRYILTIPLLMASIGMAQSPEVISVNPLPNALNVSIESSISVEFWTGVNPSSVSANTFVAHSTISGKLSGTYTFSDGTNKVSFVPTDTFAAGDRIRVSVTTGIESVGGDTINTSIVWEFTTEARKGSGIFRIAENYLTEHLPRSTVLADLNGDGHLDIAASHSNTDNMTLLLNRGDGTFLPTVTLEKLPFAHALAAGDINNDGTVDLGTIINYSEVVIIKANTAGTFIPESGFSTGTTARAMKFADVNGDGLVDLLTTNKDMNELNVHVGVGDGLFGPKRSFYAGYNPNHISTGDFNEDGKLDVAIGNSIGAPDSIDILIGNGGGSFERTATYVTGEYLYSMNTVDLNGDGHLDLLGANLADNTVSIFIGEGTGAFQDRFDIQVGETPQSVSVADLDADNDMDIVVANWTSNSISILTNIGSAAFSRKDISIGLYTESTGVGDLDQDGDIDIIVFNENGTVSVLLNRNRDADIATQTDTLRFGSIKSGESESQSFTVYNYGVDSTLIIRELSTTQSSFTASIDKYSLLPGDSATVTVTFGPVKIGSIMADLEIETSDPDNPKALITLLGSRYNEPPTPFMLLSPADGELSQLSDSSLQFIWASAKDNDGDSLSYTFNLSGPNLGFSIDHLADTTYFLDDPTILVPDTVYNWFVSAYDGGATTPSLNRGQFWYSYIPVRDSLDFVESKISFGSNYPNPFNLATTINFTVPEQTDIRLLIFDLKGREVVRLAEGTMPPGFHSAVWNGRDAAGREVPTGMYIARLVTENYTKSIKMVLLK